MAKTKIDWTNHFIEFIVVLVGIVIAFQLNEFAKEKKEQNLLYDHFDYIQEETEINHKSLSYAIKQAEGTLGLIDTLLNIIKQKGSLDSINSKSFQLLRYNAVYFRKNAYLTLTESGDIRLLDNFELKSRTINLYEYYSWTSSIEQISGDLIYERYYPYLLTNFDMLDGKTQTEDIYHSKTFTNVLASLRYAQYSRIAKYKDCLKQIESYQELLSAYYEEQ